MTIVIRIALSLSAAVITLSTFAPDADAQVLRRLRDNIRANIAPGIRPILPPFGQVPELAPQQQLQLEPQQSGRLTPFSRLAPEQRQPQIQVQRQQPVQLQRQPQIQVQRQPVQLQRQPQIQVQRQPVQVQRQPQVQVQRQPVQVLRQPQVQAQRQTNVLAAPNSPNLNGPARVDSNSVNVRVVTYFDPRTGRTFQRRFVEPLRPNGAVQNSPRQLATRNVPTNQQNVVRIDRVPRTVFPAQSATSVLSQPARSVPQTLLQPVASVPQFAIPPIAVVPPVTRVEQFTSNPVQLPVLAGPTIAATSPNNVSTAPAIVSPQVTVPAVSTPVNTSPEIEVATGEIRIDPAVIPAAATANDNQPIEISPAVDTVVEEPEVDSSEAYSVLDNSNEDESSTNFDIDIEMDSADEVEAFFDGSE